MYLGSCRIFSIHLGNFCPPAMVCVNMRGQGDGLAVIEWGQHPTRGNGNNASWGFVAPITFIFMGYTY